MEICGMDECGRGSLAGPLVACGVKFSMPYESFASKLNAPLRDSKKLTEHQKQRLYLQKNDLPITFKLAEVTVEEINTNGIGWANTEIFLRLGDLISADRYIIDGNLKFRDPSFESVIHGDGLHPEIMFASVIAKVYRDNLMKSLHSLHPQYQWVSNNGYGTKQHIEALHQFGICPHHRTLFAATALKNKIDLPNLSALN